jgi:hypothetical protein
VAATNGWGPVEKDMSNGNAAARDGRKLTLKNVPYDKGLGVNTRSWVVYALSGQYTTFRADIGIDDDVAGCARASVAFQLWADGSPIYDSGPMVATSPTRTIVVDVTGRTELWLIAADADGSTNCDHADWANARLTAPTTVTLANTGSNAADDNLAPHGPVVWLPDLGFRRVGTAPIDVDRPDDD